MILRLEDVREQRGLPASQKAAQEGDWKSFVGRVDGGGHLSEWREEVV